MVNGRLASWGDPALCLLGQAAAGDSGIGPSSAAMPCRPASPPESCRTRWRSAGSSRPRTPSRRPRPSSATPSTSARWTRTSTPSTWPTGKEKWKYKAGPIKAPPSVHDGAVYVGDTDGMFHCVDAASGKKRWTFKTEAEITSGRTSPATQSCSAAATRPSTACRSRTARSCGSSSAGRPGHGLAGHRRRADLRGRLRQHPARPRHWQRQGAEQPSTWAARRRRRRRWRRSALSSAP